MPTIPRKTILMPGLSDEGSGSFLLSSSDERMGRLCCTGTQSLTTVTHDNKDYHELRN
jgi:hypothetical protein